MSDKDLRILRGDALDQLRLLADESVQCVVTSPPYYGLRDYGVSGQIGLEPTLGEWLERLTAVFAEVRRVLRRDGTCWVNMGDVYAGGGCGGGGSFARDGNHGADKNDQAHWKKSNGRTAPGFKPKDLMGLPWRLAFALQADGWCLRSEIIWHKPNPMPESVTDRPTRAHESVFLLTRQSARYFYDGEALRQPVTGNAHSRGRGVNLKAKLNGVIRSRTQPKQNAQFSAAFGGMHSASTRNGRDVWVIPTAHNPEKHFAAFPPALVRPCVLAGTRPGQVVLDPFGGSGTTAGVALALGRRAVTIDLNPEYCAMVARTVARIKRGKLMTMGKLKSWDVGIPAL